VIVDDRYRDMVGDAGKRVLAPRSSWPPRALQIRLRRSLIPMTWRFVLFTSGTTSKPKAVELSHGNLTSYITGTVEISVRPAPMTRH